MVLKVIKTLSQQTDGAKVSDALLKRAAKLREQADLDDASAGDAWDIAEIAYTDFNTLEIIEGAVLRHDY